MNKLIKSKAIDSIFLFLLATPFVSYILSFFFPDLYLTKIFRNFIILYGIFFLFRYYKLIRIPNYLWLLIFYSIFLLCWDIINGTVNEKGIWLYFTSRNSQAIPLFFTLLIIENTYLNDSSLKLALKFIEITIILSFIISSIQVFLPTFFTGDKWFIYVNDKYTTRRISIYGWDDPLALGLNFIPLVVVYFLFYIRKNNSLDLYRYILLLGSIMVALISNARWIIGSIIILLLFVFFSYKKRIESKIKYILLLSVLILGGYFILNKAFGYNIKAWKEQRLFKEENIKETTRYLAFELFKEYFPVHPLLGTGVHLTDEQKEEANNGGSSQIHVGYLAHLVSYGIIGSSIFFYFLFLITKRYYKYGHRIKYMGGFVSLLIFIWANLTLVSYRMIFYGIFWALIFTKQLLIKSYEGQHSKSLSKITKT